MVLHKRPIIKVFSVVLTVIGIAMLLPFAVSLIYGETETAKAFIYCAVPCIVIGLGVFRYMKKFTSTDIRIREGFFIVGVAWLLMSAVSAIPLMICGDIHGFCNAFFEMASGFSTTGSTILTNVEVLSKGGLFWRSFTHWLGGMGVLVLAIAILPMLGIGGQRIMRAETTGPTMDKVSFTLNDSARRLYLVYGGITVLEIIMLLFGGMSLYDAVVHSVGTVGTGGFSCYNASIAAFDSTYIQVVIGFFMMICGVNFGLHYALIKGNIRQVFKDAEFKTYLTIVACATLFIALMLTFTGGFGSFGINLRDAYFQVCSVTTTTGYCTADFDLWPTACKIVMLVLMLMGGCAGSTGGGMKVIRFMIGVKSVKREVSRKLHPRAVKPVRIGGKAVSEEIVSSVTSFIILYLLTIAAGSFVLSFENVSFTTALTTSIACVSNIGPGLEAVGPTCNFAFYGNFSKVFMAVLMIAGRLELFTIFLLGTPSFWDKNK